MGKEITSFGDIEVVKHKFHQHKNLTSIYDVNIDTAVVSNKVPFSKKGFKYFMGYKDASEKIMSLYIMLPKMSACRRNLYETKYISFLIKDNELLEKYNEI